MKQKLMNDILLNRINGIKVRVHNKQESIAVQNELFKLGFNWGSRGRTIQNTTNHFLYCRIGFTSKIISIETYGEQWFNNSSLVEYTVDDIVGYDYVEYFHYKNMF